MPDMSALPGVPPDFEKLADLRDKALRELAELTEELGLHDSPPAVCMTHLRFVPCRKDGAHRYSTDPADVAAVREVHAVLPSYRDDPREPTREA